jgi:hypothetical protein
MVHTERTDTHKHAERRGTDGPTSTERDAGED